MTTPEAADAIARALKRKETTMNERLFAAAQDETRGGGYAVPPDSAWQPEPDVPARSQVNTTDEWLWTDWHGGEFPLERGVVHKVKTRNGKNHTAVQKTAYSNWHHGNAANDSLEVVAYAIRNPNYVAPQPVDRAALLKMAEQALEPFASILDEYDPSEDGDETPMTLVGGCITNYELVVGDIRSARATLDAIRKATP